MSCDGFGVAVRSEVLVCSMILNGGCGGVGGVLLAVRNLWGCSTFLCLFLHGEDVISLYGEERREREILFLSLCSISEGDSCSGLQELLCLTSHSCIKGL